ncbi:MAG: hypothetical protein J5695_04910 [Bacteroidales bacterium]|nr:hypothetical protein [Bacteroidales bacterium]
MSTFVFVHGKLHIALPLIILSLVWAPSAAQESIGVFNSLKGIGATVRLPENDGVFHTATAFVDIYGVATSRCSNPGLRFNVSRQYVLSRVQKGDVHLSFYAGPGVTLGYVRDHDKGFGIDLKSLFSDNEGAVAAISGDAGCRFDFGGSVALDISFASDLGIHIRKNEDEREYFAPSVSIYNNGWMQWLYPQLTILFKLR